MSSNIRKSNTQTSPAARNFRGVGSKQNPIIVLIAAAGAALTAAANVGGAPGSDAATRVAESASVPWTDHIRDVIRRAHNRLHQRNYSLAEVSVEEAIYRFIEDYLAYGFDSKLTSAQVMSGWADTIEMYCLLLDPSASVDPEAVNALLALCPAMIVELGGSVEDLDCD